MTQKSAIVFGTSLISTLLLGAALSFGGSYTVQTTPEQDEALQHATHAKRGGFVGKNTQELAQEMFNRGVSQYSRFLQRLSQRPAKSSQTVVQPSSGS